MIIFNLILSYLTYEIKINLLINNSFFKNKSPPVKSDDLFLRYFAD